MAYTIDERRDRIAESIMEKLATNVIEDRIIKKVLYLIKIDKASEAAGLLGQEIILTGREKEHFSRLSKEIVLSWFRSYIDKANKQEELEEE